MKLRQQSEPQRQRRHGNQDQPGDDFRPTRKVGGDVPEECEQQETDDGDNGRVGGR
jgi:hypothetical protein